MPRGDDIAERLIDFAARLVRLTGALPHTVPGKHIAAQLIRCGTSVGANYEEARGAESRRDFIHKLRVASKELQESRFWLRLIARSNLQPQSKLEALLSEPDQLCRILGRSLATAKNGQRPEREPPVEN